MQCLQEAKEKEFHIIAMCSVSLRPTDSEKLKTTHVTEQ